MVVGAIGAVAHGIALPCMIIVFGEMLDSFLSTDSLCEDCSNLTSVITAYNTPRAKEEWFECDLMFSQKEDDQNIARYVLHCSALHHINYGNIFIYLIFHTIPKNMMMIVCAMALPLVEAQIFKVLNSTMGPLPQDYYNCTYLY